MSPKRIATLAAALGFGVISVAATAQAQTTYRSPAKWNNFHPVSDRVESVATPSAKQAADRAQQIADELMAPIQDLPPAGSDSLLDDSLTDDSLLDHDAMDHDAMDHDAMDHDAMDSSKMRGFGGSSTRNAAPQSIPAPIQYSPTPHAPTPYSNPHSMDGGNGYSYSSPSGVPSTPMTSSMSPGSMSSGSTSTIWADDSCGGYGGFGGYGGASCATSMPVAARPALYPYFGSANVLLFTLEESSHRDIAAGLGDEFTSEAVAPGFSTGFDAMAGRYLGCGRYGFGIGYFLWNPGDETVIRQGIAGDIRATMPQYRDVELDFGSGPESVYDHIDGNSIGSAGATAVRVERDIQFQGIEANFFSFGLMGAQRVAYAGCDNGSLLSRLGLGHGRGFGGAAGPLARGNGSRVRVSTSHGFRWFQIEDDMELAFNVDGTPGYGAGDIYDSVEVENNLFGYQFGGRLTYCLGRRLDLNIGGKIGLYGNRAELRHELGTETQVAYRTGVATDLIATESSDTVLATLGELDLGLGYRVNQAWTIRGGYRALGVTGVATAPDAFPENFSSVASASRVHADGSYLLHGGYVGLDFNW